MLTEESDNAVTVKAVQKLVQYLEGFAQQQ